MIDPVILARIERADGPALIAYLADGGLPPGEQDWHSHVRGQLFYVESGLLSLRTRHGTWLMPTQRASWIPAGERHQVHISPDTRGWGVFLSPEASAALPAAACVIGTSALMRALVMRASDWVLQDELSPPQQRVLAVLLDEMVQAPSEPLHLPMPQDKRLLRIARRILAHPEDTRDLGDWARWAALSSSTLTRLFRRETSCSFAQWRQQARLCRALEWLAEGRAVADIADALGYASPSAFVAMFRRNFGQPPLRYLAGAANG